MRKLISIGIAAALLASGALVQAQDMQITYRKKTEIVFSEVLLEGQLKAPLVDIRIDHVELSFKSLIRHRTDFNDAAIKSVDVLK